MIIRESAEDYLEAILIIEKDKGKVRSIDIARHLGITKPSVSVAMKNLRTEGFINVDEKGLLSLLPPGKEIAEKTYEKHITLRDMLVSLGVDKNTATLDACRIEHVISEESFKALKEHAKEKL
ncbi:MAG: metal-dependent transcriptional regulator [Spirochaetales bacterium]|nr:metal-dependent transcriptional regulator [Spirochaetales bacterium]